MAIFTPLPIRLPHFFLEFFYFSLQRLHQRMPRADQTILLGNTQSFQAGKLVHTHCPYKAYPAHSQRQVLLQTWTFTRSKKCIAMGMGTAHLPCSAEGS